jgi:hypothetical protein
VLRPWALACLLGAASGLVVEHAARTAGAEEQMAAGLQHAVARLVVAALAEQVVQLPLELGVSRAQLVLEHRVRGVQLLEHMGRGLLLQLLLVLLVLMLVLQLMLLGMVVLQLAHLVLRVVVRLLHLIVVVALVVVMVVVLLLLHMRRLWEHGQVLWMHELRRQGKHGGC